MVENPNGPFQHNRNEEENQENDIEMEEEPQEEEDDDYPESEEFQAIDNQLEQLNSALDSLEHKNDTILAELTSLLKENREIRLQLQQQCQTDKPQETK